MAHVQHCGDTIQIIHGDSPGLQNGPQLIPWADPINKTPESVATLLWQARFDVFLLTRDKATGDTVTLRGIGWDVDVRAVFRNNQPFDKRGQVTINTVTTRAVSESEPQTKGPAGKIELKQYRSMRDALKASSRRG